MLNAIWLIIFETLKAMLLKIAFKHVLERFVTRVVIWGGRKLVSMTSNTLDDATWYDIESELTGKGLKVADQAQASRVNESFSEDWSE